MFFLSLKQQEKNKPNILYIWLSLRHWNVPDFTPILEFPSLLFDEDDSILLVRRMSCAAESKRFLNKRTAGFVVMPLRFNDFLIQMDTNDINQDICSLNF